MLMSERNDPTSKASSWPTGLGAGTIFKVLAVVVIVAIVLLAIEATSGGWSTYIRRLTLLAAIAGAAATLGALIGFVFGIPRRLATNGKPAAGEGDEAAELYESNTNLEQVSDWLTKIII